MQSRPKVISLFSGAGGLDLGVEHAGAEVRVSVESDAHCVKTLEANRRFFRAASILHRKIEEISTEEILHAAKLKRGEATLVVGGPPCQPFSKSGYWLKERRKGVDDPRASLVDEFLRVVREAQPAGFIFENVASLTHPSNCKVLDQISREMQRAGYSVKYEILHAEQYGIPQTRSRVFVVGLRSKSASPTLPKPTHWWSRSAKDERRRLKPPETAGRWIEPLRSHLELEDHFEIQGTWASALREIPPGQNYKFLTKWAGHREPLFVAETKYWTFLLKLSPYRPSWTIQASPGPWTGPLHWKNRHLAIVERAALQTFPRTYAFAGDRRSQIRQIGNAVPPLLAAKVAKTLLSEIMGAAPASGRKLRYTLADGYDFRAAFAGRGRKSW